MVYLIAIAMGFVITINGMFERSARFAGLGYANPTYAKMSTLGGLGGWFCIIPAAYFVGSQYGNGFLQGVIFCIVSLGGGLLAGIFRTPTISYLISAFTIPINVILAILVYFITRA